MDPDTLFYLFVPIDRDGMAASTILDRIADVASVPEDIRDDAADSIMMGAAR